MDDVVAEAEAAALQDEVAKTRRTADYWKAEHLAGNAEITRLELELIQARLHLMGARRNLRHVLNNVPMAAQSREQLVMMIAELDETLAAAKVKPGTDTLPVSQR